ncbi:hypothetical protein [Acinetobacter cumulans]
MNEQYVLQDMLCKKCYARKPVCAQVFLYLLFML